MTVKDRALVIFVAVAAISLMTLFKWGCNEPPTPGTPAAVETAQVITNPAELDKLPPLPGNDKPVSAIPVPTVVPKPGVIVTPYVIAGASGNTYIAHVEAIDWGFRCHPKISLGVSTDFLIGADLTVFSYWRGNVDLLAYAPIRSDLDFSRSRFGVGASWQITNGMSAGLGYTLDLANRQAWVIFTSFKF